MSLTKRPPPPSSAASTRSMPANFQPDPAPQPIHSNMGARYYSTGNLSREMENMNVGGGIPARRPIPSQPNYQAYTEAFRAPHPTQDNRGPPNYGNASPSAQDNRGPSIYGNQSPPTQPEGQPFDWQLPAPAPPRPPKQAPPQMDPSWTSGARERAASNVSTASGYSTSTATTEPMNRSTSNLSAATSTAATDQSPRISTPYSNVGLGREDFSRPTTTSSHLHPDSQTESSSRSQSGNPAQACTTPVEDPTPDGPAYICDVCIKQFSWATPRTRCVECDDYDICPKCFQAGKVSDNHKSTHNVRQVLKSHRLLASSSDLTPASTAVNPELSPPRTLPDWTVPEGSEQRWLHLRNFPSHARFMNTNIDKTGAYIMRFGLQFVLSEHVTTEVFTQLKKLGLGKLRISAGAPVSNRSFFRDQKTENFDTLAGELFTSGGYEDFELKIPDHVTGPKTGWVEDHEIPLAIHIKVNADSQGVVGFLLQWKEVKEFQKRDDVILMMSLAEVQMDELLEYDEPSPPKPTPPQPAKKTSDTSNDVSLMELLEAIAEVQQQQQQEQSVEAIFGALLAQNIVNQYNENLARLRIQQYLQEQKEKEEQEERLRMQAFLRRLQAQKEKEEQEAREQLAAQILLRSFFQ